MRIQEWATVLFVCILFLAVPAELRATLLPIRFQEQTSPILAAPGDQIALCAFSFDGSNSA
jgi:hypothetical protein